jgi:hypothetical protein
MKKTKPTQIASTSVKTAPTLTAEMKSVPVIQSVLNTLGMFAIAGAVIFLAVTLSQYLPKVDTYLQLKGRQDCATSYHLEYEDTKNKTRIVRPVEDLYQRCLTEKGI